VNLKVGSIHRLKLGRRKKNSTKWTDMNTHTDISAHPIDPRPHHAEKKKVAKKHNKLKTFLIDAYHGILCSFVYYALSIYLHSVNFRITKFAIV